MRLYFFCLSIVFFISACASKAQPDDELKHIQALQTQCLNIKSSYPFSLVADRELTEQEFRSYFSPTGLMARSKNHFDKNVELTDNTQQQYHGLYKHFKQVEQIRNEFYPAQSDNPSFTLKIKKQSAPKQVSDFHLMLNEGSGIRMLGPRFYQQYTWSFSAYSLALTLRFHDDSKWTKKYEGDWALFHFLDSGMITRTASDEYILQIDTEHEAELSFKIDRLTNMMLLREKFDCPG